jgi:hypothetical protein
MLSTVIEAGAEMYGPFVLLDQAGSLEKGQQVYLREIKGKDEAWLRDTLFDYPEIIPVEDIDLTFGPLIPLCKELRTDAGSIDAVFINERGRLTIVECKLWKNPQARREVVAQTLDYVSALTAWTYADLQRQVAIAVGRHGNTPFELVHKHSGNKVREPEFVDAVSRCLRDGRFLVLLAGDGIREGVQSLTELVNRNVTKAFTFGLVEVAIYRFNRNRLAIQPRILARTTDIIRQMTVVNLKGGAASILDEESVDTPEISVGDTRVVDKERLKGWWQPIMKMKFDDPEQEPPKWLITNNIALSTPYPGIQIKAWASISGKKSTGVYLTGSTKRLEALERALTRNKRRLIDRLPAGTVVDPTSAWPIILKNEALLPDSDRHAWLKKALNDFTNVLRPHLRTWYEETRD